MKDVCLGRRKKRMCNLEFSTTRYRLYFMSDRMHCFYTKDEAIIYSCYYDNTN